MRKILCRKWPPSTDPWHFLKEFNKEMSGSVLCAHFRHKILRTFLAHHANHLGTISWTMGPYFAPIFDTRFCAHFWYIMPTIWAPFHGPSGHHPPSLPFPSPPPRTPPSPPPLDLSSPVVCSLAYHWAGSLSEWQHASSSELPFLGPRKETVDSTIQGRDQQTEPCNANSYV